MDSNFVRPDIKEARAAMGRMKGVLVYKDDDELDTGMQKVQPLPFLDEEIVKFKKKIESSVPAAQAISDEVPEKVSKKVDDVIRIATEGKTTLFKASELLEFTLESFQYARRSALDQFDLSRRSGKALSDFDSSFKKMMSARLDTNMDLALECEEQCLHQLELAMKEAESDCHKWVERSQEEERQLESVGKLDEVRGEVKENISDEINELEMIRDHCGKDARTIDSELNSFKMRMDKATSGYKTEEKSKERRLKENREEQEALRHKLAALESEETKLESELSSGRSQEQEAEEARKRVLGGVEEWKGRIVELQSRAETSLKVMREMSDVTELIVSDAQKKQRTMRDKLSKLESESLLAKRDVLMAQGVMFKLIESESQNNIKNIEEEKEKRNAARTGLKIKVEKMAENIKSYTTESEKFSEKCQEAKGRVEGITKELDELDRRLKKLQPRLKLDQLEEKYTHRKNIMGEIFDEEMSMESVEFCSTGKYQ